MESPITQTTQHVSEWSIDTLELTDEDLEKVTGAWGGHFRGFHHHRFRHHHFRDDFNDGFSNNAAIAISNVAIAG